ncbi:MAG: DUF167 domain-containing protein [Gammaproteobacteria bacterium]|nr:DUF167 domain-containing protein [Gammaproteobacteria bacterium]
MLKFHPLPSMTKFQVKVKPDARESSLEPQEDGSWLAQLKSPPADGKANRELIALIATQFSLRKSQVRIKIGTTGRFKLVEIDD